MSSVDLVFRTSYLWSEPQTSEILDKNINT